MQEIECAPDRRSDRRSSRAGAGAARWPLVWQARNRRPWGAHTRKHDHEDRDNLSKDRADLRGVLHDRGYRTSLPRARIRPAIPFYERLRLGAYGWLMTTTFFVLGLAVLTVAVAVRNAHQVSRSARVGFGLLIIGALFVCLAGVFRGFPLHDV